MHDLCTTAAAVVLHCHLNSEERKKAEAMNNNDARTSSTPYAATVEEKLYMEATHTSSSLLEASSWKVSSVEFLPRSLRSAITCCLSARSKVSKLRRPAGQYANLECLHCRVMASWHGHGRLPLELPRSAAFQQLIYRRIRAQPTIYKISSSLSNVGLLGGGLTF